MRKSEKVTRIVAWAAGELFTICSVIRFGAAREWERALLAAVTLLLLCAPFLLEKLAHGRLSLPFFLFGLFYAIGSMLGHSYKLYYILPGWDKLLHICGGVGFAAVGYYLPQWAGIHGKNDRLVSVVFAVCFSMAVALLWEFEEYGADRLFDMDMQNDTVVHSITSYKLGSELGVLGRIPSIDSVVINGSQLPVDGYLDLGLIDTMTDTLLETLGTVVSVVLLAIDNGRHPLIRRNRIHDLSEG